MRERMVKISKVRFSDRAQYSYSCNIDVKDCGVYAAIASSKCTSDLVRSEDWGHGHA